MSASTVRWCSTHRSYQEGEVCWSVREEPDYYWDACNPQPTEARRVYTIGFRVTQNGAQFDWEQGGNGISEHADELIARGMRTYYEPDGVRVRGTANTPEEADAIAREWATQFTPDPILPREGML